MTHSCFPPLAQLHLPSLPLNHGYYTLGLIQHYRPDIYLIDLRLKRRDHWTKNDHDYVDLESRIEQGLQSKKTVLVVPWEEDIMGIPDARLTDCLNSFCNDPVFFVTEMASEEQKIYTFQHGIRCKILELPFVLVNDAICYYHARRTFSVKEPDIRNKNFLCMVGRPEPSKYALIEKLIEAGLGGYGMITHQNNQAVPQHQQSHFCINPVSPRYNVNQLLTDHRKEAAQVCHRGIWISSNVENYFHIESTYGMPLIINPESTVGIFPATEKSIWPVLLGRLYLIHGHPGIMSYVQQFSTVNQADFCDLSFDSILGYQDQDHRQRLNCLVDRNRGLIKDCRDKYQVLRSELEQNRDVFVENFYNFFRCQVNSIPGFS